MGVERKVIVITGVSSGMGEATARHLAARGARVVLGARSEDRLRQVVEEIQAAGGEAAYVGMDVAKREDVAALVEQACSDFGRLDVLVSNAGAMPISALDELAVDDWEQMIDVNIKGVLWGIAAALPVFRAQKSGHFITIASTAARKVAPTMAVYAGSKAAVVAICDGLRQEVAGELRVTTLLPGYTATNFADHIRDEGLRAQMKQAGETMAMSPDAIAYAIDQPEEVNLGEIVIRPTAQA